MRISLLGSQVIKDDPSGRFFILDFFTLARQDPLQLFDIAPQSLGQPGAIQIGRYRVPPPF